MQQPTRQYTEEELTNLAAFFAVLKKVYTRLEKEGFDLEAHRQKLLAELKQEAYGEGI